MYLNSTLEKYLCSTLDISSSNVYKFDNVNGKTGYRITTVTEVSRKQIVEIEKKTDLFLQYIRPSNDKIMGNGYDMSTIELEFIKI
jgi:hypothetical protein